MPFRVYAPSGRIDNTDYALSVGSSVLHMYEEMFDLPFPLPKSGELLMGVVITWQIEGLLITSNMLGNKSLI